MPVAPASAAAAVGGGEDLRAGPGRGHGPPLLQRLRRADRAEISVPSSSASVAEHHASAGTDGDAVPLHRLLAAGRPWNR